MRSQRIFRQAALDRLASPEQLDQLLHVTSPRSWLVLAALLTTLALFVAWSFLGRVDTTVDGAGQLVASSDAPLAAVVYVDAVEAMRVEPGMTVHLLPEGMRPGERGYLEGTVEQVAGRAAPDGSLPLQVRLRPDPDSESGYRWTSGSDPGPTLRVGIPVQASVVIGWRRPVELAIPSLEKVLPRVGERG